MKIVHSCFRYASTLMNVPYIPIDKSRGFTALLIKNSFSLDDIYKILDETELHNITGVVLNVKELPLFNSTLLGLISTLYRGLKDNDINLGITGLNDENQFVLEISGLNRKISCFKHLPQGEINWDVEKLTTN